MWSIWIVVGGAMSMLMQAELPPFTAREECEAAIADQHPKDNTHFECRPYLNHKGPIINFRVIIPLGGSK